MSSMANFLGINGFSILVLIIGTLVSPGSASNYLKNQTPDKEISVEKVKSLANVKVSSWAGKLSTIKELFLKAKTKKNIMRIHCLEPKIKSVKFWISEGNSAYKELKKKSGNKGRVNLLLVKITVIDSNIGEQVLKASRCIGDEQFSSGEGFEKKITSPEDYSYDPDNPNIIMENPLLQSDDLPTNTDWSIELTWPNSSPYR
jgi:hypothetical protein